MKKSNSKNKGNNNNSYKTQNRNKKKMKIKRRNAILIFGIVFLLCLIGSVIYKTTAKETKRVEPTVEYVEDDNVLYVSLEADGTMVEDKNEENSADEKKDDNKNDKSTNNTATYYVKVNNSANVVTVYGKDENGEYTKPVRAMVCSTGSSTPKSGKYTIPGRRSRWRALYGNVYGQWVTNIVGSILFHSVPYLENENPGSLEWWEYDKLGTSASMGCVRLTASDAQWVYYNIPSGTIVEFYSDSNPGPLGKPSAQKISGNAECRDWDPTDSTDGNPWRNQKKEEPKQEEKQTTVETKNETNTSTNNNENTNTNINTNTTDNSNTNNIDQSEVENKVENTTNTDKKENETNELNTQTNSETSSNLSDNNESI